MQYQKPRFLVPLGSDAYQAGHERIFGGAKACKSCGTELTDQDPLTICAKCWDAEAGK